MTPGKEKDAQMAKFAVMTVCAIQQTLCCVNTIPHEYDPPGPGNLP